MSARPRASAPGRAALAVLALAAVLGSWLLARAERRPACALPEPSPPETRNAASSVALAPPAEREAVRPERTVEPAPTPDPLATRCRDAVRELAGWLPSPGFDRAEWERRLRAYAPALGARAIDPLVSLAADESMDPASRASAAELLRALQAELGTGALDLPAPALDFLRDAARAEEEGPLADAAARSLAALGTPRDADRFLDGLLHGAGLERERAAAAFAFVREPGAALDLARALANGAAEAPALERGLSALLALEREQRAALDESTRDAVAIELDRLAADAELPPELRARALAALAAFAPRADAMSSRLAAQDPETSRAAAEELAVRADDESARALADAFLDSLSDSGSGRRAALARALARRGADVPAHVRLAVLDELHAGARDPDAGARRSAVHALAAIGDPSSAPLVAELARSDPDATVRASAVRALRGFDETLAAGSWAASARLEESAPVRALAEQELARRSSASERREP